MVVQYSEDSYMFVYNYGSVIFFNVPEDLQEKELGSIQGGLDTSVQGQARPTDVFLLEVQDLPNTGSLASTHKVYFDRVVVQNLSYEIIKIVCMLLAESTALE